MLHNFFSIPVWQDKINVDLDSLSKRCYEIKNSSKGRIVSNVGGWQSEDYDPELTFPDVHNEVMKSLNNFCSNIDPRFKMFIPQCWVNINKKGDSNQKHVHPNSTFVAVMYVKCNDNSGSLELYNQTPREHYVIDTFKSPLLRDKICFQPKPGDIIVFPSWIWHSVSENNSEEERISIAFNMNQRMDLK